MSGANLLARFVLRSPASLRNRLRASSLGRRLATGAFWSLAGTIVSRGSTLASSILVARIIGKTHYGELGVIQSTVGMFGLFAGFGLGTTATKYIAEFRRKDPAKAGRVMALSTLVALVTGSMATLVLLASAPWLAAHTLVAPHLAPMLQIGTLMVFLGGMNGAQAGALAGFEAFKAIATRNFWAGIASFPLIVCGARLGGVQGAVWGLVAGLAVNWLLNQRALRRESALAGVPFTFAGCTREWSILWKFSLPAVLSGAMVGPVMWACNAMLVNQPQGYAEMGIYNAANQWRAALLFLPTTVGAIVLPILSSLHGDDDKSRYRKVLWANILLNGAVAMAAALAISALSAPIMSSYGPGFEGGRLVLILLVTSGVLAAVNAVTGQAIASRGKMWVGFGFNGLWAVSLLALNYYFQKDGLGALGLAMATILAYFLHTIWQTCYLLLRLR